MGLPIAVLISHGKAVLLRDASYQHRCVWSDQLIRTIRKAQDERRRRAGATSVDRSRAGVDARRSPIDGYQNGTTGQGCVSVSGNGDVRLRAEAARRWLAEVCLRGEWRPAE